MVTALLLVIWFQTLDTLTIVTALNMVYLLDKKHTVAAVTYTPKDWWKCGLEKIRETKDYLVCILGISGPG